MANGRLFTPEEDDLILEKNRQGCSLGEIAKMVRRPTSSIWARLDKLKQEEFAEDEAMEGVPILCGECTEWQPGRCKRGIYEGICVAREKKTTRTTRCTDRRLARRRTVPVTLEMMCI